MAGPHACLPAVQGNDGKAGGLAIPPLPLWKALENLKNPREHDDAVVEMLSTPL